MLRVPGSVRVLGSVWARASARGSATVTDWATARDAAWVLATGPVQAPAKGTVRALAPGSAHRFQRAA